MPLAKDDDIDANEALDVAAMEWVSLISSGKQTQADMMQFKLWHDSSHQHAAAFQHIQKLNASLGQIANRPKIAELRMKMLKKNA